MSDHNESYTFPFMNHWLPKIIKHSVSIISDKKCGTEGEVCVCVCVCLCLSLSIYIYIYYYNSHLNRVFSVHISFKNQKNLYELDCLLY